MSYDFSWHKAHGSKTSSSAQKALAILRSFHRFESVLDVGCGDGRWLSACQELGAGEIQGVDGPWTDKSDLLIPAERVQIADLSDSFDLARRFDLAISLEVAEHVAEEHAATFVDNMVRHADFVLFGAAIPFQGGYRHINERWPSYWRDLFAKRNFTAFDPLRGALWDDPQVHYWYKQNMLVYINAERRDLAEAVRRHLAENNVCQLPIDIVHPEKYESIASYDQIAFRPLLRRLPERAVAKAKEMLGGKL